MIPYPAQEMIKPHEMPPLDSMLDPDFVPQESRLPGSAHLDRDDVWIYPTRIEDRFGNVVTFTWSGRNLTKITASDGRFISISYHGNGRIASATDGSRAWTYEYNDGIAALARAVHPDGSAWSYQMGVEGIIPIMAQEIECDIPLLANTQTPSTATITHPSGAVGVFTFIYTEHGRANVPFICTPWSWFGNVAMIQYFPKSFTSIALKSKTISGPGLGSGLTWSFDYGPLNASWVHECTSGCISEKSSQSLGQTTSIA